MTYKFKSLSVINWTKELPSLFQEVSLVDLLLEYTFVYSGSKI